MLNKICSKCENNLPITDYHVDRTLPNGTRKYRAECKYCVNKRHSKYSSSHKIQKNREWKEKVANMGTLPYWNIFASKQNERCRRMYNSFDELTGQELMDLFNKNPCCNYCGKILSNKDFSPDHIIPLSKNGRNLISNIAVSCWSCNKFKLDASKEDFFEKVKTIYLHMLSTN